MEIPVSFGPMDLGHIFYFLRPILLFANIDVSITKIYLVTSILAKSITGRME
jgi:hypothetical protein